MAYTTHFVNGFDGELVCSLPVRASRSSDYVPVKPVGGDTVCVSYEDFGELVYVSEEFAAQFLHLATYMRDDGALVFDDGTPFTFDDVQRILRLDNDDFVDFTRCLCSDRLRPIYEEGGLVYLNRAYAYRPNRTGYGDPRRDFYFSAPALRSLFENINRFSYELIRGFLFALPYIHREWNVVCYNPDEPDYKNIVPMEPEIFRKLIYPHPLFSDVVDDFFSLFESCCFNHGNGLRRMFEFFYDIEDPEKEVMTCVDPLWLYSGSHKSVATKLFNRKKSTFGIPELTDDICFALSKVAKDIEEANDSEGLSQEC